jgi:hypothetical protein
VLDTYAALPELFVSVTIESAVYSGKSNGVLSMQFGAWIQAETATHPSLRDQDMAMAERWRALANSFEFADDLDDITPPSLSG